MKLYLFIIASVIVAASACGSGESNCNGACYNPNQYSCATDINGAKMLCPVNFKACNGACYSPNTYHCVNGGLIYGAESSSSGSSSSGSSSSGSAVNPGPAPAPAPAPSATKSSGSTTGSSSGSGPASCAYGNENKMAGNNFYDQFDFFTGSDPTHGFVKFVDRNTAQNTGLISVNGDKVYMGVDHTNQQWGGRPAVRLSSKASFTTGLVIIDLDHMPGSVCGSWPAFWTVGGNWPYNGEIDIIEGVNNGGTNQITLHTNSGCSASGQRNMTGRSVGDNCDVAATGNAGCGVTITKANSYGTPFNNAGGGAYAMERSADAIKVWFFPKGQYPADLLSGKPNPCSWPAPDSHTPLGGNCPGSHFQAHNIIFDITFCGDWAGAVFGQQCGGNCNNFVASNPNAFSESYWLINSVRLLSR